MAQPIKWNRSGHIVIRFPNGNVWSSRDKTHELDFSFDIKKPLAAVCMNADITIWGMNREMIDACSTWTAQALALAQDIKIEVWAGYENTREDCIFSGTIFYAMPSMPPDRQLKINARSGWFRHTKCIDGDQTEGVDKEETIGYKQWFEETAKIIGGVVDTSRYVAEGDVKITRPSFEATATHDTVYRRMCEQARNLTPRGYLIESEPSNGTYQFKLINELDQSMKEKPVLVSAENGMIGLPVVRYADVEVTMLLNTAVGRGGYINLVTKMIPRGGRIEGDANTVKENIYRVYEIHHHGQLRGEKWYTTVKAWRFWRKGIKHDSEGNIK